MIPMPDGRSFIVIGENIHASRTVKRTGRLDHVDLGRSGRHPVLRPDGDERILAIPDAIRTGSEFATGRVKHVKSAILAGLAGRKPEAAAAGDYVRSLALRQEAAGADYLPTSTSTRRRPMSRPGWQRSAGWSTQSRRSSAFRSRSIPRTGTSSRAGWPHRAGRLARRSSTRHRSSACTSSILPPGMAVRWFCRRPGLRMPASADARVSNAQQIVEAALAHGLPINTLHIDALVLPTAVEPEAGASFLESVRRLRAIYGSEAHLTGGLSNVSFGLPARRLLNDVFIDLAVEAGADCGVIDPIANDPARVFGQDRSRPPTGSLRTYSRDTIPTAASSWPAYRAGRLTEASPRPART
ncbi:MAG: dihydropteroate synthase [Acidimicrobiia bacterium]|nr:dihydropteroate synthase [Acidimicrobiia bacterium]